MKPASAVSAVDISADRDLMNEQARAMLKYLTEWMTHPARASAVKHMTEWTIGPGECARCSAYVAQLVRFNEGGSWLCDECAEEDEELGE